MGARALLRDQLLRLLVDNPLAEPQPLPPRRQMHRVPHQWRSRGLCALRAFAQALPSRRQTDRVPHQWRSGGLCTLRALAQALPSRRQTDRVPHQWRSKPLCAKSLGTGTSATPPNGLRPTPVQGSRALCVKSLGSVRGNACSSEDLGIPRMSRLSYRTKGVRNITEAQIHRTQYVDNKSGISPEDGTPRWMAASPHRNCSAPSIPSKIRAPLWSVGQVGGGGGSLHLWTWGFILDTYTFYRTPTQHDHSTNPLHRQPWEVLLGLASWHGYMGIRGC